MGESRTRQFNAPPTAPPSAAPPTAPPTSRRTVEPPRSSNDGEPPSAPTRKWDWRDILAPVASLKITVVLFALAMVLILAGTVAQRELGNWTVVDKYFRPGFPFIAWIKFRYFLPTSWAGSWDAAFPFPGGTLIGAAMLINLLAAHLIRFRVRARGGQVLTGLVGVALAVLMMWAGHQKAFGDFLNLADQAIEMDWKQIITFALFSTVGLLGVGLLCGALYLLFGKRDGIVMLHGGVILLLVGEAATGLFAVETQMPIAEGQTLNWAHDIREAELVILDPSYSENMDWVMCINQSTLEDAADSGEAIADAALPFDITVERFMTNSQIGAVGPNPPAATHGRGPEFALVERPEVSGTDQDQQADIPGAILRISRDGKDLGQFAVNVTLSARQFVEVDGKPYEIFMRFRRYYKPYSVTLLEFRHDKFVGTNTPRNFSSRVRLVDPQLHENREVLIYMNHPLRYRGETFFQASFFRDNSGTVLSVVDNPGAWMPYYSCLLVGLGMTVHFGRMLLKFAGRSLG